MIFRNLDSSGDWTFGQGLANYIAGIPAIGLNIKTRLLSWLEDCFFDQDAGVDWLNRLGSKNQKSLLDMDLRRIILQSFGVVGIVTFSSVLTGRTYTASYTVNTIYSTAFTDTLTRNI